MNYQDRESLLYNILSGIKIVNVDDKVFKIKSPDVDIINESNFLYTEVYNKAIQSSYSKESLNKILISRGFFSLDNFKVIDTFSSSQERLQKLLYYSKDNPVKMVGIKEQLSVLRKEYMRNFNLISKYDIYTAEGVAGYFKLLFILSKTVSRNNKPVKYNKLLFDELLFASQNSTVSSEKIRYLARTSPWSNMWIGLKNNGLIFKTGVSISLEQQQLLMWTKIYESVYESSEPPGEKIISDDDLFDGWMLCQKDPNKEKNQEHQEVFIIAETDDDLARINAMNDANVKNIKNQRINYIYENKEVQEQDLPDVKRDISLKMVNMERDKIRGK